ncbi:DUF3307 domain-containing protein [Streptomyces sp. VTCC 41912]|uniref:DUF3307 domain-containing protein n=1 Tax=Streptomyces sp. VTCC 41912 TaxID=3383243 RepID=UPI0038968A81
MHTLETLTRLAVFASGFVALFAAHHAADYLLQSDTQSERKAGWDELDKRGALVRHHHGWGANQMHAATHSIAELVALVILAAVVHLPLSVTGTALAVGWNHLTHSIIDRRWIVRAWMANTGSAEFIHRGGMPLVDQSMHIVVGLFPAALLLTI